MSDDHVEHFILGAGFRSVTPTDMDHVLFVDITRDSDPHIVFNYFDNVSFGPQRYHELFSGYYKRIGRITVTGINDVLGKFSKMPYIYEYVGLFTFMDYLSKRNCRITLTNFVNVSLGDHKTILLNFFFKMDGMFQRYLNKPCPFVYEESIPNGTEFVDVILMKKVSIHGEERDMDRCKRYSTRRCVKKEDKKCVQFTRRVCLDGYGDVE